jgi:hypothetical protein
MGTNGGCGCAKEIRRALPGIEGITVTRNAKRLSDELDRLRSENEALRGLLEEAKAEINQIYLAAHGLIRYCQNNEGGRIALETWDRKRPTSDLLSRIDATLGEQR